MPSIRPPPSLPELQWSDLARRHREFSWGGLVGSDRVRFTFSGRAGIYQYLEMLRLNRGHEEGRQVVLVPAFHCPTVVDPILHAGYRVRFFAVDDEMKIDVDDFLSKLGSDVAAALFIQYFGFNWIDDRLLAACREHDVRVIEDRCHSFLSANPLRLARNRADATIYSFWKLIPSVIGGGVLLGGDAIDERWPTTFRPDARDCVTRMKALAGQLFRDTPFGCRITKEAQVAKAPVPAIRKPAREAYPYDVRAAKWRIPRSAKAILLASDLATVVDTRRRHYEAYSSLLVQSEQFWPIRNALDDSTCPWGFPVLLTRRQERDYLIRARGVPVFTFGEVLHPLLFEQCAAEPAMLESARFLSDNVLAFAIHQQLRDSDIEGYAMTINVFVEQLTRG
jgi:perosamine synthetase